MHQTTKEEAEEAIARWKIICEYLTELIELSYKNEDWEQTVNWMWEFPNKVKSMCEFYQKCYLGELPRS